MYTQEVFQAMDDDRRREAVQIERQARAMQALQQVDTLRSPVAAQRVERHSFMTSVRRVVRSATALL